jgi:hypothetical protein
VQIPEVRFEEHTGGHRGRGERTRGGDLFEQGAGTDVQVPRPSFARRTAAFLGFAGTGRYAIDVLAALE